MFTSSEGVWRDDEMGFEQKHGAKTQKQIERFKKSWRRVMDCNLKRKGGGIFLAGVDVSRRTKTGLI